MLTIRNLDGGGDKEVAKMLDVASGLGVDIIEVLWTKETSPNPNITKVIGYYFPVIAMPNSVTAEFRAETWVEGQVTFYPDASGRRWGYIYDTPENRKMLYSSFNNGWYRIVDKNLRETIKKEAEEAGYKTELVKKTEENVKKTAREINAEKHAKQLESRLEDMMEKMKSLQKELEYTKNERNVQIKKRVEGTPVVQEDIKEE